MAHERARFRDLATGSLLRLAETSAARGDLGEAVRSARRATEVAPAQEAPAVALGRLLARVGDRAGALRELDRLTCRLADEFGIEPSAETREAFMRIRGS